MPRRVHSAINSSATYNSVAVAVGVVDGITLAQGSVAVDV